MQHVRRKRKPRAARSIPEREIAMNLVLEFAESGLGEFSLLGFYDDDAEFIDGLRLRLNVRNEKAWYNKLRKVVRRLVDYGVLYASMRSTHKEYIGEPARQMNYGWRNPGKPRLLTAGPNEHINEPEWEATFLLRHAYPKERSDDGFDPV